MNSPQLAGERAVACRSMVEFVFVTLLAFFLYLFIHCLYKACICTANALAAAVAAAVPHPRPILSV